MKKLLVCIACASFCMSSMYAQNKAANHVDFYNRMDK